MVNLIKNIKCPYCGEKNKVNLEDYVVDETNYEREMGDEIEYTIEDCIVECKECNKSFSINGSIWEYPEGSENSNELEIEECDESEDDY